jgi:TIR domain
MNNGSISSGNVFVSYSSQDRDRVEPIVKYFTDQGFTVWWDQLIEPGQYYRPVIQQALDDAACLVVVWTAASVANNFVHSEVTRAQKRGILIPVVLDPGVGVPIGFDGMQHADLSGWDGMATPQMIRLVDIVRKLVARGPNKNRYESTLENDPYVVGRSTHILSELNGLAIGIESIGLLLTPSLASSKDIRGVLEEVGKTYRVVNDAILRFIKPALSPGSLDATPYIEMERDDLRRMIDNGRGHCSLILTHYRRYGGLRDSLKAQLRPVDLDQADQVFDRLATGDDDLFHALTNIGAVLTGEARAITNLILSGQEADARKRIIDARAQLAPLETQLSTAMSELQRIEGSLGYVESTSTR